MEFHVRNDPEGGKADNRKKINSDLYPLQRGDQFTLALASSLSLSDVTMDTGMSRDDAATKAANDRDVWRPGRGGLADDYEYVMCAVS